MRRTLVYNDPIEGITTNGDDTRLLPPEPPEEKVNPQGFTLQPDPNQPAPSLFNFKDYNPNSDKLDIPILEFPKPKEDFDSDILKMPE
jgi:hypothetical protein